MATPFDQSLKLLYPTPILKHQFEDMEDVNQALRELFLQKEQEMPQWRTGNAQRSNIGGWRSAEDLANWNDPNINHLVQRIGQAVKFLNDTRPIQSTSPMKNTNIYGWANINRNGQYNSMHIHPGFHWGAVYYVCTGQPEAGMDKNGVLEFIDPRNAAGAMPIPGYEFGQKYTVTPEAGLLVIFPAWLMHCVHPFFGEGERISLAFNISLSD